VRSSGMSLSLPTRRCMMAGLIGIGAAPLQTVDPTAPAPAVTDAVLLTNLFTRIATHVRVNGERHVFVIDTGAERSAISDTVARGLDLIPDRPVMVHGITSAQLSPTVRINWLDFSGRRFADLNAPVFARAQLGADGLLGLDVLSRFRLRFDLLRRRVTMTASADHLAQGVGIVAGSRIRRDFLGTDEPRPLLLARIDIGSTRAAAFVDSGAQYSIGNLALARAVGALDRSSAPIPIYGVVGQEATARAGRLTDLVLGGRRLGPTPLLFADLHAFAMLGLSQIPAIIVGADILTRFSDVVLDYGRGQMTFGGRLRPPQIALTAPPSTRISDPVT